VTLTPEDIEHQVFKERFRGYDPREVDRFLDRVAARINELIRERDELTARVRELSQRAGEESEDLLKRTLVAAQRTADETVAEAKALAEQAIADARAESEQILEDARLRAAEIAERSRADAQRVRGAVAELRRFREEYRERIEAVVADQLAALDRAGDLPDVPDDLAAGLPGPADGEPAGERAGDR
jgi:cell division initiation protein